MNVGQDDFDGHLFQRQLGRGETQRSVGVRQRLGLIRFLGGRRFSLRQHQVNAYAFQNFIDVKRLSDVVHGTRLQSGHPLLVVGPGRQKNDGDGAGGAVGLQKAGHGQSVLPRHAHIQQDQIGCQGRSPRITLVTIERHAHAIGRIAQSGHQKAKLIRIVVHDQYVR